MALPRLTSQAKKQMSDLQNRLKFSLYLLGNLPGAWFFGCRVNHIDEEQCIVKLPYSWFSKNPFKSIYFAAQCAAAELSTGLPTAVAITGKASTSMLLVKIETTFHKKANQTAFFTCAENQKAQEMVNKAIESNEPQTFTLKSIGKDAQGNLLSETLVTWSVKKRSSKSRS